MVDAGLKFMALDESCLGDIGSVDLNDAAKIAHAVPSREHNPKSAIDPLNSKAHGAMILLGGSVMASRPLATRPGSAVAPNMPQKDR